MESLYILCQLYADHRKKEPVISHRLSSQLLRLLGFPNFLKQLRICQSTSLCILLICKDNASSKANVCANSSSASNLFTFIRLKIAGCFLDSKLRLVNEEVDLVRKLRHSSSLNKTYCYHTV